MLALAATAMLGITLFLAPVPNQARADVETHNVVTGSVVTPDGHAVADADVWLVADRLPAESGVTLGKARTDANGLFRLVVSENKLKDRNLGWRALWSHKTGLRPARVLPQDDTTPFGLESDRAVKITLEPTISSTFRLLDPHGEPVSGSKVAVVFLNDGRSVLPEELSDRLSQTTDTMGRVVLSVVSPDLIRVLRTTSNAYGSQRFYSEDEGFKEGAELKLSPVGSIEGRITADDQEAIRHVPVQLGTHRGDSAQLTGQGQFTAISDERGRFSVPTLAIGRLFIWAELPDDSRYQAVSIEERELEPASRTTIEIPLKRLIHVRGFVREQGSNKPIEGVGVCLSSPGQVGALRFVQTNSEGAYESLAMPGSTSYLHLLEPKPYLKRGYGIETAIGEKGGQTIQLVELVLGETIRGVVVDEHGAQVAGAKVEGKWNRILGPGLRGAPGTSLGGTFSASVTSNARGEFILEGIHKGANVMLEASALEASTERPQQAAVGAAPVKLVISGANTVALVGRVVDKTDKPVAGALIQIRCRSLERHSQPEAFPIRFTASEIVTDADGRFRTPRQIKRGFGYRAEIRAGAGVFMPECSPWLALKSDARAFFPKFVLRRLRTVRGRVVDSLGKPVEGATVRQSGDGVVATQAHTDAEGRFALPGVLAEPAFVFVAKDGFRFEGKAVDGSDAEIVVTLSPVDKMLTRPLKSLSAALSRAEELAILHRTFDGYAQRVINDGGSRELYEVLSILVVLNPARALELSSDDRLEAWQSESTRLLLAVRLVPENYDEGCALIAAIPDPTARSTAYADASAALPQSDRSHQLELLQASLISARAIAEPVARVSRFSEIGRRLLDLGRIEDATNVLREGQGISEKLTAIASGARARSRLAEQLARVDPAAALKLLEATEEGRARDEHLGRIAQGLAQKNPAEAGRILGMISDAWQNPRDLHTERVCYRMVTADRNRAMALAAAMKNPRRKARALARMALALEKNNSDHATATRLLGMSFGELEQAATSGRNDWADLGNACTVGAGLLPIVEQVDARMVQEFLSRTLALRPQIPGPMDSDWVFDTTNAYLAAIVARYDLALARQLLSGFAERALARRVGLEDWDRSNAGDEVFYGVAVVDPARAATMIDSLLEPAALGAEKLKNAARLGVARILSKTGTERWRELERRVLHPLPDDTAED